MGMMFCFSSCSNQNDIEISYATQLDINLSSVTNNYTYQLYECELNNLPENNKLEVTLLIYNGLTGELVYKELKYVFNYLYKLSFDLQVNTQDIYKAIVITRVVSNDKFSYWEISDVENINSLKIKPNINNSDFGVSQIVGIGFATVKPSERQSISVNPAGALLIPRIICNDPLATEITSVKLNMMKYNGEYRFDKDGDYSFHRTEDASSCIMEFDPRIFHVGHIYSNHAVYTYKFIPIGCEFLFNIELSGENNISFTEQYDYREYKIIQGNEYVFRFDFGSSGYSSLLGDATGKNYYIECDKNNFIFGKYYNSFTDESINTLCINTQIGRIQNKSYIIN